MAFISGGFIKQRPITHKIQEREKSGLWQSGFNRQLALSTIDLLRGEHCIWFLGVTVTGLKVASNLVTKYLLWRLKLKLKSLTASIASAFCNQPYMLCLFILVGIILIHIFTGNDVSLVCIWKDADADSWTYFFCKLLLKRNAMWYNQRFSSFPFHFVGFFPRTKQIWGGCFT